jgi:molecular chaperone DnaK (HSP70)
VEVHFDFDTNGILTVTATEKDKGQQQSLVVNDTQAGRLSSHKLPSLEMRSPHSLALSPSLKQTTTMASG